MFLSWTSAKWQCGHQFTPLLDIMQFFRSKGRRVCGSPAALLPMRLLAPPLLETAWESPSVKDICNHMKKKHIRLVTVLQDVAYIHYMTHTPFLIHQGKAAPMGTVRENSPALMNETHTPSIMDICNILKNSSCKSDHFVLLLI